MEQLVMMVKNYTFTLAMKIIWRATKFGMNLTQKNMGDYHDHCLEKDILALADVFKKFIDTCLKFYKLDACH